MNGLVFNNSNVKIIFILLLAFLISLTSLIFYIRHLMVDFTYDSPSYAMFIENNKIDEIFHPHHLLYNYFKWLLFNIFKNHGYDGRALFISQLFNAAFGAICISLFFLTVRYITKNILPAFMLSVILCFCLGYWQCSTFGGVRIMGVIFLILLFFIITYFLNERKTFFKNILFISLIAIVHSLAVFPHQTHIMFVPVVIAAVVLKKECIFNKLIYAFVYIFILMVIAVGIYYYIGRTVYYLRSKESFYVWLTSYARTDLWGKLTQDSLSHAKSGIKRTFMGDMGNNHVVNTLYYSLCFIGIYSTISLIRLIKRYYPVIIMCAVWLMVYVPFFIWWEPLNIEFWTYILPSFLILISLPVSDLWNRWKFYPFKIGFKIFLSGIFSILTFLFVWYNVSNLIIPRCDASKNKCYVVLNNLNDISRNYDDLIVISGLDAFRPNLMYFTPHDNISVYHTVVKYNGSEDKTINAIKTKISDKLNQKNKIFISKDVLLLKNFEFIHERFDINKLINSLTETFVLEPAGENNKDFYFYEVKGYK